MLFLPDWVYSISRTSEILSLAFTSRTQLGKKLLSLGIGEPIVEN